MWCTIENRIIYSIDSLNDLDGGDFTHLKGSMLKSNNVTKDFQFNGSVYISILKCNPQIGLEKLFTDIEGSLSFLTAVKLTALAATQASIIPRLHCHNF